MVRWTYSKQKYISFFYLNFCFFCFFRIRTENAELSFDDNANLMNLDFKFCSSLYEPKMQRIWTINNFFISYNFFNWIKDWLQNMRKDFQIF